VAAECISVAGGTVADDCLKSLVLDRSGWWMPWYRGWIRTIVDLVCLAGCSDTWGPLMESSYLSMPIGAVKISDNLF
jgi:hypothetical protein